MSLRAVPIVPNAFEEIEALSEPELRRVLPEHHVVTTTRCYEYDCRYVIETLYPFSPLVPLTTDVEHTAKVIDNCLTDDRLRNTYQIDACTFYATRPTGRLILPLE